MTDEKNGNEEVESKQTKSEEKHSETAIEEIKSEEIHDEAAAEKKSLKKRIPFLMIILILSLGIGSYLLLKDGVDAVAISENTKKGLLTVESVNASFQQVGGKVLSISVEEGQMIEEGGELVKLDSSDVDLQIAQLLVNMELLDVQIEQTRDSINSNREKIATKEQQASLGVETAKTSESLLLRGSSAEDIEQQKLAIQSAKQSENVALNAVEIAQQSVESAQQGVTTAENNFNRMQALHNDGLISLQEFEAAKNSLDDAKIKIETAKKQVEQAKKQHEIAQTAVSQQEAALAKLQAGVTEEEKRQAQLATEQARLALSEAQLARNDIENSEYNIDLLLKQKEELAVQLDMLETQKERMVLKAPAAGKVARVVPKIGENISPGSPAIIIETGDLFFEFYVNEEQVLQFETGQTILADVVPLQTTVEGTVSLVNSAPGYATMRMSGEKGLDDISSFLIKIVIEDNEELLPGMTVEVNLNEATH